MNVSTVGKESRNLATLKKIDPSIEKICCEASHTCVYEFDSQQSKWDRYGVEGTAFIVRRTGAGKHQPSDHLLIVLNKVGLENLVLNMGNCKKAKIQVPFIMMKCNTETTKIVFGLWFHDDAERDGVFQSIQSVLALESNSSEGTSTTDEKKGGDRQSSPSSSLKGMLNIGGKKEVAADAGPKTHKLISPSDFTGRVVKFYA